MKIVTPNYYKDFKCIADKCSDGHAAQAGM